MSHIDPRPFQAALEQAEARLARYRAQIAQARDTAHYDNALVEEHP